MQTQANGTQSAPAKMDVAPYKIPYKVVDNLDELLHEIPEDSIVSRTVWKSEQVKATLFGFAAGQALSDHTAANDAIIQVLSGTARITLGSPADDNPGDDSSDALPFSTVEAQPGTWIYMPAHLIHSVVAHTPMKMLLLMLKGK